MFNYTKKTEMGTETNVLKLVVHVVGFGILAIVGLIVLFGSWTIIAPDEEGVVIRLGNIDRQFESGFHWKMPWFDQIVKMDVSTKKIEVQASAASKDLQVVTTNLAVQYELIESSVSDIFTEYKKEGIKSRVIDPAIQDAIKASTALFDADELITKRAEVKDNIFALLNERLSVEGVFLKNVDIVNFDFSESFNSAIEEKVTAEQNALAAENKLEQVKFEAQQEIEKARADATRTELEARALSINSNLIEKIRAEASLEAAKKWKGDVPQSVTIIGGDGSGDIPIFPFLNVK